MPISLFHSFFHFCSSHFALHSCYKQRDAAFVLQTSGHRKFISDHMCLQRRLVVYVLDDSFTRIARCDTLYELYKLSNAFATCGGEGRKHVVGKWLHVTSTALAY